jgi:S-DNA-T family DNA segregation ATPase FtsK/SpoIIIE
LPSRPAVAQSQLVPYRLGRVEAPEQPPIPVAAEEPGNGDPAASDTSLLAVILRRLVDVGPRAHRVWLPPLAEPPPLDALLPPFRTDPELGLTTAGWNGRGGLRVPVGVIDRPLEQRRDALVADLTGAGGHVGIGGAPQSGKSTLVRTLVAALALTHTPREVQFYCLDFGGGTLVGLAGLPHVGSVAGRQDRDRVHRTVAEVSELLAQRERRFAAHGIDSMDTFRRLRREGRLPEGADDAYGDVFLVVDGWSTLHQDFDAVENAFSALATNGLNYGVHLVVTASRWSEIRPWLRDLLGTRLELHLGDPVDSEVGMRIAANVPHVPGRGLTRDGLHFLAALPRVDGANSADDLGSAVRQLAARSADAWTGPKAAGVRLLPAVLDAAELPEPDGDARVAFGLDEQRLAPVWHDFDQHPHLMVFGDTETGKTNLLRLFARALVRRYHPDEARVLVGDQRRGLYEAVPAAYQLGYAVTSTALEQLVSEAVEPLRRRLPGPGVTPDQLRRRDWWTGPRLFVFVDDYDYVSQGRGSLLGPLLDLLPHGAEIGLHLVLARATSGAGRAMMMDDILRRLWEIGTPGLLFSCDRQEGTFLGDAPARRLPGGRAQLVTRRAGAVLVQTGHVT